VAVVEDRVKEMANNRKRSVLVLLFLCSIVEREREKSSIKKVERGRE
jgi:hypothetical protein